MIKANKSHSSPGVTKHLVCDAMTIPGCPLGGQSAVSSPHCEPYEPPVPKTIQTWGVPSAVVSSPLCGPSKGEKALVTIAGNPPGTAELSDHPQASVPIWWMRAGCGRAFCVPPEPFSGCSSCLLRTSSERPSQPVHLPPSGGRTSGLWGPS